MGQHPGHVLVAKRTDVDLGELAAPAQLGADGAEAVVARELVAAVTADQHDRDIARGVGQSGQQAERGLVGPLQVVEEQRERPAAARRPSTEHTPAARAAGSGVAGGTPRSGKIWARTVGTGPAMSLTAGRSARARTS